MPLFTIILDYRGGTYIRQARGSSPKKALTSSVKSFDVFSPKGKEQVALAISQEEIVRVDGTSGVWCISALARGELALLHIVATAE
jgi:hypothetical protein